MSAILDYWEERLVNWALWKVSGSMMPMSACDLEWGDGAPRQPPPLVGEALNTDDLVMRLSEEQQYALRIWYVWTGSLLLKSEQSGIHRNTLADRVRAGKFKIDDMDNTRKRASREALREWSEINC